LARQQSASNVVTCAAFTSIVAIAASICVLLHIDNDTAISVAILYVSDQHTLLCMHKVGYGLQSSVKSMCAIAIRWTQEQPFVRRLILLTHSAQNDCGALD
jgi:hypothetical protein